MQEIDQPINQPIEQPIELPINQPDAAIKVMDFDKEEQEEKERLKARRKEKERRERMAREKKLQEERDWSEQYWQKKYWNFMVKIMANICYLDVYAESSYLWDRRINVFTALSSSTSIAGWLIWEKFTFIWAAVIAGTQILTTVKPYLPYSKRLEVIRPFQENLKILFNDADCDFHKVLSGEMEEDNVNKKINDLQKRFNIMESTYLKSGVLLEKPNLLKLLMKEQRSI